MCQFLGKLKYTVSPNLSQPTKINSLFEVAQLQQLTKKYPMLIFPKNVLILKFKQQKMGNSPHSELQVSQPLTPEWVTHGSQLYCSILRNIETSQELQQYSNTPLLSLQQQMQIYQYRHHQKSNLVRVVAVQKAASNGFCNNSVQLIVTTQRIPRRLSELRNLKYEECLSILYSALIGYQAIYEKVGYLEVNDEMIGFTRGNECRVWLNENFSKNQPESEYQDAKNPDGAYALIIDIISTVSKHSSLPLDELSQYIKNPLVANPSFILAITKLQEFLKSKSLSIPTKLTLEEATQEKEIKVTVMAASRPQSAKVNKEACVLSSSVFQINPKEPNIQKKYSQHIQPFSRIHRYQTPQRVIHNPPLRNVRPEPNNIPMQQVIRVHQQMNSLPPFNERRVKVNQIQSPENHQHIFKGDPSRLKRLVYKSPQFQSVQRKIKSPIAKIHTHSTSNLLNTISSKFDIPASKLIPSFSTLHPSRFHPPPTPAITSPPQITPLKLTRKGSSNNSLQTTGQFLKLQQIDDAISQQLSYQSNNQSNRMNSFIPTLPLSSNDDERLDLQQIVANIKSQLDDVQISKNTTVLVDKSYSNQHIAMHMQQDGSLRIIEEIKSSKQYSRRSRNQSEKGRVTRDMVAVSFGAAQREAGKENMWLSLENFKEYIPITNTEIKRLPRGAVHPVMDGQQSRQESRNRVYL